MSTSKGHDPPEGHTPKDMPIHKRHTPSKDHASSYKLHPLQEELAPYHKVIPPPRKKQPSLKVTSPHVKHVPSNKYKTQGHASYHKETPHPTSQKDKPLPQRNTPSHKDMLSPIRMCPSLKGIPFPQGHISSQKDMHPLTWTCPLPQHHPLPQEQVPYMNIPTRTCILPLGHTPHRSTLP